MTLDVDVEDLLAEYDRRKTITGGALREHKESFVDAIRAGFDRTIEQYNEETGEDASSIEDVGLEYLQDNPESAVKGATEYIAERGAEYIGGADTTPGSLEEEELINLVTGASKRDIERKLTEGLARTNSLEELTSTEFAKMIEDDDAFTNVENRLQRYNAAHIKREENHPQAIAEEYGMDEVLRADLLPPNYAAELGLQYDKGTGPSNEQLVSQTLQSRELASAVKPEARDMIQQGNVTASQYSN
jgi:hypothetical protein